MRLQRLPLASKRDVERLLQCVAHKLLHGGESERTLLRDLFDEFVDRADQPFVRHHRINEARGFEVSGRNQIAGKEQLLRQRGADFPDQSGSSAGTRQQPEVGVTVAELCALCGNDQIAAENELEAPGQRGAVDRSDHRLGETLEAPEHRRRSFDERGQQCCALATIEGVEREPEVGASAERAPLPGYDDDSDRRVNLDGVDCGFQLVEQVRRERVHGLGSVERDPRRRPADFTADRFFTQGFRLQIADPKSYQSIT